VTPPTPWTCLTAGIPLTLLLDLAAGDRLVSAEILAIEQAAQLAAAEWEQIGGAADERAAGGAA
jgi:hypothetical protein